MAGIDSMPEVLDCRVNLTGHYKSQVPVRTPFLKQPTSRPRPNFRGLHQSVAHGPRAFGRWPDYVIHDIASRIQAEARVEFVNKLTRTRAYCHTGIVGSPIHDSSDRGRLV